jgi:hypothetical protein
MSTIRWAASLVTAGLLVGCATPKPPEVIDIPTLSLEDATAQLKAVNPQAIVGTVKSTVELKRNLIAAGDLPDGALSKDEPVSIVKDVPGFASVAEGKVVDFYAVPEGKYVIIQLLTVKDSKRPPEFGDLVVRMPMLPYVPGARAPMTPMTMPTTMPTSEPAMPVPTPAPAPAPAADAPKPAGEMNK